MLRENWISDELTPSYGALAELWHGRGVIVVARIVVRLFADLAGLVAMSLRPRQSVEAESAWTG